MNRLLSALVLMSGVAMLMPAPSPALAAGRDPRSGRRGADPRADAGAGHSGGHQYRGARQGAGREPAAAGSVLPPFFNLPQRSQPEERETQATGSGVIVDAQNGYILTNDHVVENADQDRGHDKGQPALHRQTGRPGYRNRCRGAADPGAEPDRGAARRFRSAPGRRFRVGGRQSVRPWPDRDVGDCQRARAQRPRHRGL